jgi:hypothetical protein
MLSLFVVGSMGPVRSERGRTKHKAFTERDRVPVYVHGILQEEIHNWHEKFPDQNKVSPLSMIYIYALTFTTLFHSRTNSLAKNTLYFKYETHRPHIVGKGLVVLLFQI